MSNSTTTKQATQLIQHRSVVGVLSHTFRTFALQLIALIASLLLSGLLDPQEFGVFFTVTALVNLFTFLSDVGLAASLIQKKQEPSKADLATTFTVQEILGFGIAFLLIGLTPLWRRLLHLDQAGIYLLYALGISFPLASLKTIPSILLERDLDFNRLVIPQIVENIIYYGVVVLLAWKGFGVSSYTYGVLLRGVAGVVVLYYLKPWRPKFALSLNALKSLLKFGVPFQLNDLLARIKDDLLIVVMKVVLGNEAVGYLGWAKKWSLTPFRFTVDSIVRVTFPAFSRLQHDKVLLEKAITKALFFIALLVFPILFGMVGMAWPLTVLVRDYTKWQPAIPALAWFSLDVMISALTVPAINALNALGKITTSLKLMVAMTSILWVIVFPLSNRFGFTGVAIATAITTATALFVFVLLRSVVQINVFQAVVWQMIACVVMICLLIALRNKASASWFGFFEVGLLGGMSYIVVIALTLRNQVRNELLSVLRVLRHS